MEDEENITGVVDLDDNDMEDDDMEDDGLDEEDQGGEPAVDGLDLAEPGIFTFFTHHFFLLDFINV